MDEWSKENTQFSVILLQMIYPPFVSPGKYVIQSTIKSLYPAPPPSPVPFPPPPPAVDKDWSQKQKGDNLDIKTKYFPTL